MEIKLEHVLPEDIERCSFEIISREMGDVDRTPEELAILKRVIHATADFDYVDNLVFSHGAADRALSAIRKGAAFITDTKMASAGINRTALYGAGCQAECYIDDPLVAQMAKINGTTRAAASMDCVVGLTGNVILAVGNAPTALVRACELIREGKLNPSLVIGVPVGFVNVEESKQMLLDMNVPSIVARGRKGGSTVAAAVCNALLYLATGRTV